jgi:ubiquitin C-terminal hydrolase
MSEIAQQNMYDGLFVNTTSEENKIDEVDEDEVDEDEVDEDEVDEDEVDEDEVDEDEADEDEVDEDEADNNNPSAEEYIDKFFELTNIYRDWKKIGNVKDSDITAQQLKTKNTLQKRLSDELSSTKLDGCDLNSIHLFHEGNTLYIECWDKGDDESNRESSNINVIQYKILLDNKVFVDEEIENIRQKLNDENYLSEIDYMRNNLLEYQAIVGKESDDYLLNLENMSSEELERKYQEKETSYDGLENDIFEKMIDLVKMKDNLEKQHMFLLNYKSIINVKNELFGKQDSCGDKQMDNDKITVKNIEKCLQHCQLKYIDFLRVLNDRYMELDMISIDEDKKKAIMFDIVALEKQISTLYNTSKNKNEEDKYKLEKGALIKVQENGDIFLGIAKKHSRGNTNVAYCNKIMDSETDKYECKNVRDMVYNKDKEKEVVVPILDFIKYYKNIAHLSNPIIKKGFVNDENYEDYEEYDVETYRNIEKTKIDKTNFTINKNRELVNDLGIEEQKNILFEYLNENKDKIKDKIHKFCKGLSYISTEDINNFTDDILDGIYKEIPLVYTSLQLQDYVHNYVLRFIKHVCDHTRIEFNVKNMDVYKTQEDKEKELLKEIQVIQKTLEKERFEDEIGKTPQEEDVIRSRVVTYGRKGLLNIGNTCFMNAAIQVFSNIKQLREFLFSLDATNILDQPRNVENQLDRANSLRMSHLIVYFKNILSEIWSGRTNTYVDADKIRPFRQKISNFNMGGQHDANEIFMQIYNDLHEFLQEPFSVPLRQKHFNSVIVLNNGNIVSTATGDEDNEIREEFVKSPEFSQIHRDSISELRKIGLYSIISQLFNIVIRRVTINSNCEEVDGNLYKINYNTSQSLKLDIPHTERNYWICSECETENVFKPNDLTCEACNSRLETLPKIRQPQFYKKTLEELLSFYTSQETLPDGETLQSTVCPESFYNIRETRIVSLPYVLNVSLQRTISRRGNYLKIDIPIHVPLILDMGGFIEPTLFENERIESLYGLQTIVWHGGYSEKNGGHYKVWSKQGGKWVEFNDSQVKDVIPKLIEIDGKSYIQDYEKSDYVWNIYMITYIRQDIDTFTYKSMKVKAVEVVIDDDVDETVEEEKEKEPEPEPIVEKAEEEEGEEGEEPEPEPIVEEKENKEPGVKPDIQKPTLVDVPEIDGIDFVIDDVEPEIVEKEIDPDLVEVIVSYKVEPNNENLLLEDTKFFFDEEDNSYYLVDNSGEPVSFYMLYDKNAGSVSDGNKVPIDNVLFYYNSEIDENMIYGKIPELESKIGDFKVKDIENKLFEIEFTINK